MGRYDFNYGYNEAGFKPVDVKDIPSYECMGAVVCMACGKHHGYCVEVMQQLTGVYDDDGGTSNEENTNMAIPRSGNTGGGNQPQRGGRRKGSGLRYLSEDMLSTAHQGASIVDARVQDDKFRPGNQCVVVKLKFKGEHLLWTLRPGNPVLDNFGDTMGDDEQQWKDREVELYLEEDSFDGKKWIRAEVVATATKKRG